jgi:hypothetical protein
MNLVISPRQAKAPRRIQLPTHAPPPGRRKRDVLRQTLFLSELSLRTYCGLGSQGSNSWHLRLRHPIQILVWYQAGLLKFNRR